MSDPAPPSDDWLDAECRRLLDFGRRVAHPLGGAAWLDDDGAPDLSRPVHTWVTSRTVHVYSLGHLLGVEGCAPIATAALDGLRTTLHDAERGGWFTAVADTGAPTGTAKSCYDHAFVMLAASSGVVAGLAGADDLLAEATDVFERHFWEEPVGRVVNEWDRAWTEPAPYRGLNSSMHSVEAMLAVGDVTGEQVWLERAGRVASYVVGLAAAHDGRLPEHFGPDWSVDLELNRDRPDDPFKPFGATIGHGLEWARLLLHVEATLADDAPAGLADTARLLFDRAVADGWEVDGAPGFVYTTDWDGAPVVRTRMHWVAAEGAAAAAALHRRTGEEAYAERYAQWWAYVVEHLRDAERGSWHHELDPRNRPQASVWPGKPDLYHAVQATLLPRLPLSPSLASALAVRTGSAQRHDGGMTDAPPRVLVVGEALVDVVPDGDGKPQDLPGGSPANVAITLGRLGRDVRLVTLLGDDDRGAAVRAWLEASDVTVLARPTSSGRTPSAVVTLDDAGAASYVFDLDWHLGEVGEVGDVLHVGSIATVLEPGADAVLEAARAHHGRALVSLDPNARPAITPDRAGPVARVEDLVTLSDVVKASDEDLHWLHPDDDPVATATRWAGVGPGLVVVTRGGEGAVVVRPGGTTLEVPGVPVAVADTVGAGDTFTGVLVDALLGLGVRTGDDLRALSDRDVLGAVTTAAIGAAINVSRAGANPPSRAELDAALGTEG